MTMGITATARVERLCLFVLMRKRNVYPTIKATIAMAITTSTQPSRYKLKMLNIDFIFTKSVADMGVTRYASTAQLIIPSAMKGDTRTTSANARRLKKRQKSDTAKTIIEL
jgi:hypothetical protein